MIEEAARDLIDFAFSTGGLTQDILLKISLWFITFFVLFKGVEKVFPQNRAVCFVTSLVISIVGIRFLPEEWFENAVWIYTIVGGIALFLGPYILISMLADLIKAGRTVKWILVIVAYSALIYYLPAFGITSVGIGTLDNTLDYLSDNRTITAIIFVAVLVALILLRRKLYRGAGWGFGAAGRGVRGGLRGIGRGGIRAGQAVGNSLASGGRYMGRGFAVGAGAGAGLLDRRTRELMRRLRAQRRARRIAAIRARRQAAQRGGNI